MSISKRSTGKQAFPEKDLEVSAQEAQEQGEENKTKKRKGFYDDRELSDGGYPVKEIEDNFKHNEKVKKEFSYDKNTSIFCNGEKVV